jgi:hypothetical protein
VACYSVLLSFGLAFAKLFWAMEVVQTTRAHASHGSFKPSAPEISSRCGTARLAVQLAVQLYDTS